MMRTRTNRRLLGLGLGATTGLLSALAMSACGQSASSGDDTCVSNEQYFKETIYTNILAQDCQNCHSNKGAAKDSNFILQDSAWGPDYMEHNLKVFESMAKLEYEDTPWVLLKPSLQVEHGGMERFKKGSAEYKSFQEMIARLENPVVCDDDGDQQEQFFAGVQLLDEVATLRKAALSISGRMPTLEEEQFVRDGGFEALDGVLDDLVEEDAFYERLIEIYNDHFLTDRYYPRTRALDLLASQKGADDEPLYPMVNWFESLPEDQRQEAAENSNKAVARESLQLIAHVVRQNKPFTEILTADYTMVNPYSAKVYGLDNVTFADGGDYGEFVPAKVPGVPHAGVLTTTVFLNRFPTTDTNRNRARARVFYDFFLATDVLALGTRPVQSSAILGVAPWLNNQQCAVCHEVVDPVAGAFQNFDARGRYAPPELGWFGDMKAVGYGDKVMPPEQAPRALNWLVGEAAKDRRFAMSAVHVMYKGLSGDEPLKPPTDPNEAGYLEGIRAADMQAAIFDDIAQKFIDSNYNLKVVVKELVRTPYYRAYNATGLDETRELELARLGTGRLLIPEQLNRKIQAVTGIPWRPRPTDQDLLLNDDNYRIFYGGIDSDDVTERITEPNGIMANVAKRMANEMACATTALDFARPDGEHLLFPYVTPEFSPEDANGFEVPAAASAIRANIQYLHAKLLGEYLDQNDPEINRTYELFLKVWKEGQRGLVGVIDDGSGNQVPEYAVALPNACQARTDYWTGADLERPVTDDPDYTIRSWMAVMSYLLSDYRFLHE